MSENQISNFGDEAGTGLDWFAHCLLIGLVVGLGVNAVSYFFLSEGIADLVDVSNKVSEAIGFPEVFWSDEVASPPSKSYVVSMPNPDIGSIDYSSLGWNLMFVLVPGGLMGVVAALFRRRLNALVRDQRLRRRKSPVAGSHFQISMRGILLLTTVVAASIAVSGQLGSIERQPVESSNLASVGYKSTTKTLEVEFQSGSVYRYFQVPAKVYQEFKSADSLGRYLSKNIRNNFPYEKSSGKRTSVVLLEILVLGPLYLFTFAILFNRLRWKTKIICAVMLGAVLICVSMSAPVRVDMNSDRVLMGLFVFWMPQVAFFILLRSVTFAACALFFKPSVAYSQY